MSTIQQQTHVSFSAEQMFDLVNSVTHYPEFVPYCKAATVKAASATQMIATLVLAKKGFSQSFTTVNQLTYPSQIDMQLHEGPFRHLTGKWIFLDATAGAGCSVHFHLNFEFNNPLLHLTMRPVFEKIMVDMVRAFTNRAQQVYA